MNRLRDYLHDASWYAHKATLPVRNAAYQATRPIRSARGQYRNDRNRRTVARGRRPFTDQAGAVMSSKPELSGRALNRKVKRLAREYPEDMSPADRARRANRRARRRDFWSSRRLRARAVLWGWQGYCNAAAIRTITQGES